MNFMFAFSSHAVLVAFSSFAVAAITSDKPLTADRIFPAMSLFMLLQFPLAMVRFAVWIFTIPSLTVVQQFAQVTSNVIEALVSVNRLSAFLAADELQVDARYISKTKPNLETGDQVLSITNGEFAWSQTATSPTLEDVNLTVKKGELVGVMGRVGAGKVSRTSLCIHVLRANSPVIVFCRPVWCQQ